MKKIRFSANWFDTGPTGTSYARFEAGKDYPADDAEAQRCVARGIAVEVEVPDEEKAEPTAEGEAGQQAEAEGEPASGESAPAAKAKKTKA